MIANEATDNLQMLGVIPRSPSPIPIEERPLEELSVEELHELVRRQRAQINQNIKQEYGVKPMVKNEKHDQVSGYNVLDNEASSDVEVLEVAKKREIEVVELSDEE